MIDTRSGEFTHPDGIRARELRCAQCGLPIAEQRVMICKVCDAIADIAVDKIVDRSMGHNYRNTVTGSKWERTNHGNPIRGA
jgi:hypothetical protein